MNAIEFLEATVLEDNTGVVYRDVLADRYFFSPMADISRLQSLLSAGVDPTISYNFWRRECNHQPFVFPSEMIEGNRKISKFSKNE